MPLTIAIPKHPEINESIFAFEAVNSSKKSWIMVYPCSAKLSFTQITEAPFPFVFSFAIGPKPLKSFKIRWYQT